jgi:hypothetical protein
MNEDGIPGGGGGMPGGRRCMPGGMPGGGGGKFIVVVGKERGDSEIAVAEKYFSFKLRVGPDFVNWPLTGHGLQ